MVEVIQYLRATQVVIGLCKPVLEIYALSLLQNLISKKKQTSTNSKSPDFVVFFSSPCPIINSKSFTPLNTVLYFFILYISCP